MEQRQGIRQTGRGWDGTGGEGEGGVWGATSRTADGNKCWKGLTHAQGQTLGVGQCIGGPALREPWSEGRRMVVRSDGNP